MCLTSALEIQIDRDIPRCRIFRGIDKPIPTTYHSTTPNKFAERVNNETYRPTN